VIFLAAIVVAWAWWQIGRIAGPGGLINLARVKCPRCGADMPIVRVPRSLEQALWGGGADDAHHVCLAVLPGGLVKEKVTVAIAAALSGAVLLTAINNQLGVIGYTMLIAYVFYLFFALCLLCIVAVLEAERLRTAGSARAALIVEQSTRVVFALAVAATVAAAVVLSHS
jgi:hypothetical protein